MLAHLSRMDGKAALCCGLTADRLPIGDRMEEDPALATCAGLVLDVPDTVNAKRFPPKPFVIGDVHAPGPPWVSHD
jgi:hypothetical protein